MLKIYITVVGVLSAALLGIFIFMSAPKNAEYHLGTHAPVQIEQHKSKCKWVANACVVVEPNWFGK